MPISYINGPTFVAKSFKVAQEHSSKIKIVDGNNYDIISTNYNCISGAGFTLLKTKDSLTYQRKTNY